MPHCPIQVQIDGSIGNLIVTSGSYDKLCARNFYFKCTVQKRLIYNDKGIRKPQKIAENLNCQKNVIFFKSARHCVISN